MKKSIARAFCIVLLGITTIIFIGCGNSDFDDQFLLNSSRIASEQNVQDVNSSICTKNGFELVLFSDKDVYSTADIIEIWATLEYVGNNDTVTIWSGIPYISFSITDGKDFNSGGITFPVLMSTVLEKGELYYFNYQKSGSYDANVEFWEKFYDEEDLLLPVGEYTITVHGDFSLTEKIVDSQSGLLCELRINIV